MWRQTSILSTILTLFLAAAVLAAEPQPSLPLVSAQLLQKANLSMLWQNKLAVHSSEQIQRLFLAGDSLWALTNRNYLFCLDAKTGRLKFGQQLARKGLTVFKPLLFEDQALLVAGNTLLRLDPQLGTIQTLKAPPFTVTCPAARNTEHIYLAGTDRRLHAFNGQTRIPEFEAAPDDNTLITSIVATDDYVVFATAGGSVVNITPHGPVRNWQFTAKGPISARLVLDNGSLFVAAEDTSLYRIDPSTGKPLWTFRAGARLTKSPRLTATVVYQPAGPKGLYAIDKQTGKLLWQRTDAVELLAQAGHKAYVIAEPGTLIVMDNGTAKELYCVNFAAISRYAANTADNRIYIGDQTGRVACLQPTQ
jgi:outer membrane protein assembly factor BamB